MLTEFAVISQTNSINFPFTIRFSTIQKNSTVNRFSKREGINCKKVEKIKRSPRNIYLYKYFKNEIPRSIDSRVLFWKFLFSTHIQKKKKRGNSRKIHGVVSNRTSFVQDRGVELMKIDTDERARIEFAVLKRGEAILTV